MNTVFIIISILNGYKNVEGVFAEKQDAEKFADDMRNNPKYCEHEIYNCEYKVW